MRNKHCFSCKRGEVEYTEADGTLTKSRVHDPDTGKIEGHGWLCDDHLRMYEVDGWSVKTYGREVTDEQVPVV